MGSITSYYVTVAGFSSHSHFVETAITLPPLHSQAAPIPRRCFLRHWAVTSTIHKSLIPISNSVEREHVWVRCYNVWWRWVSRLISFFLLVSLNLVALASDYPPPSTTNYPCEDTSGYYSQVKHLSGEALKKKLNSIIAPHHSLSYHEVWDALKVLDAADVDDPEDSLGIYQENHRDGIVREHLWPRSYGLTNGPSLTDLHNIRPADVNVNSSRGNKYFGECMTSSTKCLRPANKEAALDTETDKQRWAPPMQVRGDIARALMYMAVCYGFQQPGLRLSDTPSVEKREMGLLSTLLKWNEADPPSREEKLRNERICKLYQHNRNPFVDHPEYANLIWKQLVSSRPGIPHNHNNAISSKKN